MAVNTLPQVLKLEVPLVVRLAERTMRLSEVLALVPGSIIQLEKDAQKELDLMVNNTQIGWGTAVKVSENFGIRLTFLGDQASRLAAVVQTETAASQDELDADALAEAMLAGQ